MKIKSRSLYFVAKNDHMIGTFLVYIGKSDGMLEFITMPEEVTIFTIPELEFENGVINGKYELVQRIKRSIFTVCNAEYKRLKEK